MSKIHGIRDARIVWDDNYEKNKGDVRLDFWCGRGWFHQVDETDERVTETNQNWYKWPNPDFRPAFANNRGAFGPNNGEYNELYRLKEMRYGERDAPEYTNSGWATDAVAITEFWRREELSETYFDINYIVHTERKMKSLMKLWILPKRHFRMIMDDQKPWGVSVEITIQDMKSLNQKRLHSITCLRCEREYHKQNSYDNRYDIEEQKRAESNATTNIDAEDIQKWLYGTTGMRLKRSTRTLTADILAALINGTWGSYSVEQARKDYLAGVLPEFIINSRKENH